MQEEIEFYPFFFSPNAATDKHTKRNIRKFRRFFHGMLQQTNMQIEILEYLTRFLSGFCKGAKFVRSYIRGGANVLRSYLNRTRKRGKPWPRGWANAPPPPPQRKPCQPFFSMERCTDTYARRNSRILTSFFHGMLQWSNTQ